MYGVNHLQCGDDTQKTICLLNKTFNARTGEWCQQCYPTNLHSNPSPFFFFFSSFSCFLRIAVLKSVISFVLNKKQVCVKPAAREGGKELRREEEGGGGGWQWWGGRVCFSHPFHPKNKKKKKKKKKNLRINPRNRFRLKVADSKLFLFAIRQLSSNVWDDTASILFIDYQQETFSMLTMCATLKSPCCCCCCCCCFCLSFLKFIPLPPKKKKKCGGVLTWKWTVEGESCASIFIHAEHALSTRNRDGDECCIYLSFTSWYANIMRSAHQITKASMNTDSVPCFRMQPAHREHKYSL